MVEAMGGWHEDAAALITKLANHTGKEADENAYKCWLIFSLFQILSKMLFDYQLDCENDFLLGSGEKCQNKCM
jgi:hypothetical protein